LEQIALTLKVRGEEALQKGLILVASKSVSRKPTGST